MHHQSELHVPHLLRTFQWPHHTPPYRQTKSSIIQTSHSKAHTKDRRLRRTDLPSLEQWPMHIRHMSIPSHLQPMPWQASRERLQNQPHYRQRQRNLMMKDGRDHVGLEALCYESVHCTTWPEIGFQRGFGQWLQLMRCANLLAAGPSISIINVHKFQT